MMMSEGGDEVLGKMKQAAKDQRELDKCAEGFEKRKGKGNNFVSPKSLVEAYVGEN